MDFELAEGRRKSELERYPEPLQCMLNAREMDRWGKVKWWRIVGGRHSWDSEGAIRSPYTRLWWKAFWNKESYLRVQRLTTEETSTSLGKTGEESESHLKYQLHFLKYSQLLMFHSSLVTWRQFDSVLLVSNDWPWEWEPKEVLIVVII
jgi:hypothetical protein